MLRPRVYTADSINRLGYFTKTAVVLAVVICGYLSVTTVLSVRRCTGADALLRRGKTEAASLSREVATVTRAESKLVPPSDGGVDTLAVQIARWAGARRIKIDSFMPEGAMVPTEINCGDSKLGVWNVGKVRLKGQGEYAQFMSLMDELRVPRLPVQLDSFTIQSANVGSKTLVSFDLMLTVYEKKSGAI